MDKASRWFDLVAFLLSRHYGATREEIFRNVGGYDGEPEANACARSITPPAAETPVMPIVHET
jgi:hypothetical protein